MTSDHVDYRRHDLDWLRVFAFALLILYHIGMFYVTWDWHVKSVHAGPQAEWLMRLLNPWRLALLFFVSGVALRFAVDKAQSLAVLRGRVVRLGLPILFGMAVIVAPQAWLELLEKGEFAGSFIDFYPSYMDFGSSYSIITPTWNHLWYVVYLLVYTLIVVPCAGPLSRLMAGAGGRATANWFSGRFGWAMALLILATPQIVITQTLAPLFPTTHNLVWDWATHAHYFTIFLCGLLLAKDRAFWAAIDRFLPVGSILLLATGFGLTAMWVDWQSFRPIIMASDWLRIGISSIVVVYAWLAIFALFGIAQRWLNHRSRTLAYLNEAVFPWYILHQTLIVAAGFWLTRQGLSGWVEFTILTAATFIGCLLIYEFLIRRVPLLRPVFGLKRLQVAR